MKPPDKIYIKYLKGDTKFLIKEFEIERANESDIEYIRIDDEEIEKWMLKHFPTSKATDTYARAGIRQFIKHLRER